MRRRVVQKARRCPAVEAICRLMGIGKSPLYCPVIVAGHPKRGDDLGRATTEDIDYRTDAFSLDGIAGS